MCDGHDKLEQILAKYQAHPESLISILQDLQDEYRYLPQPALRKVAHQLGLPLIQVCEVATFFKAFSLEPCGKHTITLCMGTACHIRGAPAVLDELYRELGIKPGETTPDMLFTLETVNCIGACALGPVMMIDGSYYGQMTPAKVQGVIEPYSKPHRNSNSETIKLNR